MASDVLEKSDIWPDYIFALLPCLITVQNNSLSVSVP
jgi:hypothetical protein